MMAYNQKDVDLAKVFTNYACLVNISQGERIKILSHFDTIWEVLDFQTDFEIQESPTPKILTT